MDDIQERKLKLDVNDLKRRVGDHDSHIAKYGADIAMLKDIAESNKEIAELLKSVLSYAKKTYEVFEPLARMGAKLAKFGLLFTALWHGAKYIAAKIALVWP